MKNIQLIQIWQNGQFKQASILDARIIYDDLNSLCTFYYELKSAEYEKLADGNITLSGEDYINWDGTNEYAFNYIAQQLVLVII